MKKFVAVFCLLLCAATLQAKDKPNPADFPIKIHISASQLAPPYIVYYGASFPFIIADTILDGKKIKLAGNVPGPSRNVHLSIIIPGDYQIRLKKEETEKDSGILSQEYEILLPNGDIWNCSIVGISE